MSILDLSSLEDIVAVHISAFPRAFLTALGTEFLASYYALLLRHPAGMALGCFVNDQLSGFAAGVLRPDTFNREIGALGRRPSLIAKALARHPSIFPRLVDNVIRVGFKVGPEHLSYPAQIAELTSVGIRQEFQRSGMGRLLVHTWVTRVEQKGYGTRCLCDASDCGNLAFYDSLGFRQIDTIRGVVSRRELAVLEKV